MAAIGTHLANYLCLGDHIGGRGDQAVSDDDLAAAIGVELSRRGEFTHLKYPAARRALAKWAATSCRPDLADRIAAMPSAVVGDVYVERTDEYAKRNARADLLRTHARELRMALVPNAIAKVASIHTPRTSGAARAQRRRASHGRRAAGALSSGSSPPREPRESDLVAATPLQSAWTPIRAALDKARCDLGEDGFEALLGMLEIAVARYERERFERAERRAA